MCFIQFLIDTPVVAFLLLLGLLVTVVPVVAAVFSRKKSVHSDSPGVAPTPAKAPSNTRFLGTQMDIAILIFGLLLLLGVIGWARKNFFG